MVSDICTRQTSRRGWGNSIFGSGGAVMPVNILIGRSSVPPGAGQAMKYVHYVLLSGPQNSQNWL